MTLFEPVKILIEKSALDLPYAQKLLRYFSETPVQEVDEIQQTKKTLHDYFSKNVLLITDYKGDIIKRCPGTRGALCCNYYVANIINGCPFYCTYCILHDYINCGSVMICANTEKFFDELRAKTREKFLLRLGTGELADSLALEPFVHLNDELLPGLKECKNVVLELKTKSAFVDSILKYDVADKVVVGWSVNPQNIIDTDEYKSASLKQRIEAARIMAQNGYKVTFHFDPIILVPDWQEQYRAVIRMLRDSIPGEQVAWLSLGGLRFTVSLRKIIQDRFKKSDILSYGEFVPCPDGKLRYFRPVRVNMYRFMLKEIMAWNRSIPVYLCMESQQVWKQVFGSLPLERSALAHVYTPYPDTDLHEE
ncbi:MAG: radical SAM protein [Candidatus Auribacterota bacterium]|jgi:spore photoproduct lyase|nr:radical SAM protein [Candidatus Auribacterota bacterium]